MASHSLAIPGCSPVKLENYSKKLGHSRGCENRWEVNSLLINRVSDLSRTLFLTGTPVPLTAWKDVPYSQKSNEI